MKELGNILEDWSKWLAILGTVALAGSVVHDYAFLWRLGLSFTEVPTTLQDHVRSLIVWAPAAAVLMVAIAVILGFQIETEDRADVEDGERAEGDSQSSAWPLLTFIGMPAILFVIARGTDGLVGALPLLSILVALLALRWKWIRRSWPQVAKTILLLGMFFASVVFAAGHDQARRMIYSDVSWVIKYADSTDRSTERTRGIRRFGDASIVVDESRTVHVIRSSEIVRAYRVDELVVPKRNVCTVFGWLCD